MSSTDATRSASWQTGWPTTRTCIHVALGPAVRHATSSSSSSEAPQGRVRSSFLPSIVEGARGNPLIALWLASSAGVLAGVRLSDPFDEVCGARLEALPREVARVVRVLAAAALPMPRADAPAGPAARGSRHHPGSRGGPRERLRASRTDDRFSIAHELLAEAVEALELTPERREIHAALAQQSQASPALAAWHWSRAARAAEARDASIRAATAAAPARPGGDRAGTLRGGPGAARVRGHDARGACRVAGRRGRGLGIGGPVPPRRGAAAAGHREPGDPRGQPRPGCSRRRHASRPRRDVRRPGSLPVGRRRAGWGARVHGAGPRHHARPAQPHPCPGPGVARPAPHDRRPLRRERHGRPGCQRDGRDSRRPGRGDAGRAGSRALHAGHGPRLPGRPGGRAAAARGERRHRAAGGPPRRPHARGRQPDDAARPGLAARAGARRRPGQPARTRPPGGWRRPTARSCAATAPTSCTTWAAGRRPRPNVGWPWGGA